MKKQVLTFSLIVSFIALAFAQSTEKATITGQLTDQQNQPMAFANVLLLHPADSSLIKGTITDSAGVYLFEMVQTKDEI